MNDAAFIRSQLLEVERLLERAGSHPVMGPNLRSRRDALSARLGALPTVPAEPRATLYFTGPPVQGSSGIEADFAADVLKPITRMVKAQFAEMHSAESDTRRPSRDPFESRLLLTALPRGSFGLELTPSGQARTQDAQLIGRILEQLAELISASAAGDSQFGDASNNLPSRLLVALRDLLRAVSSRRADMRFVTGGREVRLPREQVTGAYERVRATVADEQILRINGVSRGIALELGRFDFRTDDGDVISGFLADEVDEARADELATWANRPCVAVLRVTSVTSRGGSKRTKYELLDLVRQPDTQR